MSETATLPETTTIAGVVTWLHAKSNAGWSLARLTLENGGTASVVAKFGLRLKQFVQLDGEYTTHPQYGPQFTASGFSVKAVNPIGIRTWLENSVVGCGKVKADRALIKYGAELEDVLVNRTVELANFLGIRPESLIADVAQWHSNRLGVDVVGDLVKRGCGQTLAVKIVEQLGAAVTRQQVFDDPYYLIGRVDRVGWKIADSLAMAFGIKPDSDCRLLAAVDHACQELSEGEGHTAYGEATLVEAVAKSLNLPTAMAVKAIGMSQRVQQFEPGLYVHTRYGRAERDIETAMANNPRLLDDTTIDQLANQYATLENGVRLEGQQLEAFKTALAHRIVLITGGAGVGKTTIVRCIANAIQSTGLLPFLVAPTGKAAVRISEATGRTAMTVHRFLGLTPNTDATSRSLNTPPPVHGAEAVICDETSMVDAHLMARLATSIRNRCRLVLVGDPNQLPSVGPGAVLRDLIASRRVPHVHLDVCHRQAGLLRHNCYSILSGGRRELFDQPSDRSTAPWAFVKATSVDSIRQGLERLFAGSCHQQLGTDQHSLLVATPTNKGPLGTWGLNLIIQKAYQKAINDIDVEYRADAKSYQFFEGDRVVWTKNDYNLGLMNGELGRVVESAPTWIRINFDTRGEVDIQRGQMDDLSLAWAMTVHKLQGSQAYKVIVICAEDHVRNYGLRAILNRSWLYTGATRSTDATILLGDEDSIRQVIARDQRDSRMTTLFRPSRIA